MSVHLVARRLPLRYGLLRGIKPHAAGGNDPPSIMLLALSAS